MRALRTVPFLAAAAFACDAPLPGPEVVRTRVGDTLVVDVGRASSPDTARLEPAWSVALPPLPPPPSAAHPIDTTPDASGPDSAPEVETRGWGTVDALAVGPSGDILVARRGVGVLRLRSGDTGPEPLPALDGVGRVSGVAVLPGGRVAVRDEDAGLLHVVGSDGAEVLRIPLPPGRPVWRRDAVLPAPDGGVWLAVGARFPDPPDRGVDHPRTAYLHLDAGGALVDSLAIPARYADACPVRSQAWFASGRFEDVRGRYYPMVTWGLGTDGMLVVGCPASYTFDRIADGEPVVRVVRVRDPVTVPEAERRSWKTAWTAQMLAAGRFPGWGWRGPDVPGVKPAYHALLPVGERVWVWPTRPSVLLPSPATWRLAGLPDTLWVEPADGVFDVFGPEGTLVEHVAVGDAVGFTPWGSDPHPVIRGDTVWAVTPAADGRPTVTRYHLRRDGPAGS